MIYINNKLLQECYNPEPLNPLTEIISSPQKSKKNLPYRRINFEKEEQKVKRRKNKNNDNNFIYQTTENKERISNINDNEINEIRETKISENIKITQKEDITEFPTNKRTQLTTNNKNILSTMMQTNGNKSKNDSKNINCNNSNSSNKIKIKKILFDTKEDNTKYQNLDLEVINSWNLPKGLKLHIKKDKLENSLRNGNDGKIFFGYEENNNDNLPEGQRIDYLLMPKDNEYNDKFIGIHFMIKYNEDKFKYYIKDLGCGYGTFIKLINRLKIVNNLLINVGDTFIVFALNKENDQLILKLFTGDEQSETYEYSPDKKIITIGRDKSSDIYIEDKLLSRKQCYIYYNEDENEEEKSNWFIKDGDINGKSSTNDTWMYTFKETLIYDQMVFKTNHNLFKCNLY